MLRFLLGLAALVSFSACNGNGKPLVGGGGGGGGGFVPRFGAQAFLLNENGGTAFRDTPEVCCDGQRVYVVWEDERDGQKDIYFNRSEDGGATWLPNDLRLDTDVAGTASSTGVEVCCDGQRVYVAWLDDRNGAAARDVFLNYSADGGVTWQPSDIRIDTSAPGAGDAFDVSLCCSGSRVYAVWNDTRDGFSDIRFNYSADGGATWQANDIRIDAGDAAGSANSFDPQICCIGLDVHVVWREFRFGDSDIHANHSADGGATWQGADTRIDGGDVAGANVSDRPRVCCDAARVYVIWQDDRAAPGGDRGIYANASLIGGATWQANAIPVRVAGDAQRSSICCDGLAVHASWQEDTTGNGNNDIWVSRSLDGISWTAAIRLDVADAAGASHSNTPKLCCSGENTYIVWGNTRNGAADVVFNYSTDRGVTWNGETRLDGGDAPGAATSQHIRPCCDGLRVYAVWEDTRLASQDIFFNASIP